MANVARHTKRTNDSSDEYDRRKHEERRMEIPLSIVANQFMTVELHGKVALHAAPSSPYVRILRTYGLSSSTRTIVMVRQAWFSILSVAISPSPQYSHRR